MSNLTPRIQTAGHWGDVTSPSRAVNLVAETMFDAATRKGDLSNLRLYRKGSGDGVTQPAIGLSYRNVWDNDVVAGWSFSSSSGVAATAFETISNAFDSKRTGLVYSNAEPNKKAQFVKLQTLESNRAHCMRFFLFETHEDQHRQVVAAMWGDWRLEIVDRSLQIMRKSAAWTQAQQNTLDDLLNVEEDADDEAASVIRQAIYAVGTSEGVQVSQQKTDAGVWFELTFIPEPRGILNIITDKDETPVEVDSIIESRVPGVLWPATNITITTTGGAMIWQTGKPQFATAGYLKTIEGAYDGMAFRKQTSQPVGTGVTVALDGSKVKASLSGDGAYSPFLYSASGFVSAGERSGSAVTTWDSNSVADYDENGQPIKEFTPQYESGMKRRGGTLIIRNRNGNLQLPGVYQQILHDRMCDITLGGDAFITRGIVRTAMLAGMKAATAGQAQVFVTNAWTELVLEIGDQWSVMDTDVMIDNPKGDGLRLGEFIRMVLRGAGVRYSEMAGVSSSAGRRLPSAGPGEDFLIQPGGDVSRGDYLRSLVLDWGMGMVLSISRLGIWTLAHPSATIKAAFSSTATEGYRILDPLDIIRDFGDSYNLFIAEGAEINGVRLRQTWRVSPTWLAPEWIGFTGRTRRFPVIRADYCRTAGDLQWLLRSQVRNHAKPGRWMQFLTNFHKDLDIGDRVTVDGVACEIERIDGGSIQYANDRMTLVARELISVGA